MAETNVGVNDMANEEHLSKLNEGAEAWHWWRYKHPDIRPDLRSAKLIGTHLAGIDLNGTFLICANLVGADLRSTKLNGADLRYANLNGADLRDAKLVGAKFNFAKLKGASLSEADLTEADFGGATVRQTTFGNVDLSVVKGLDIVNHEGPSSIGIDTIISSRGKIPEIFLRQAGIPDSIIEAIPSLVGSLRPTDFYSCFISHSTKDYEFAERLYTDLIAKGVRCWFAPKDLKIGEEFPNRIEEAIRLYDKLLVILSEHSVKSSWVEDEVRAALEKEEQFKREQQPKTVLFSIKIDNAIEQEQSQWVAMMRRKRQIGDFTRWKQYDEYLKALSRLLRDLKAE
jgi:hypothetical protein